MTPNLVSRQTFGYDDSVPFNNRSDVYEYDFGSGAAGALIRRTHTEYLKTNSVNSTDYTTTSIHIRSLPAQIQIFDAAGVEKARTTFEYDNYGGGNNPLLEPRTNISGFDSSFSTVYATRGNLTRTTSWILSTSTQLHSYLQYDVAGNIVKTIDARGNPTTFEFNDRYGSPDTEAQGNSAPSELSGQTSYAFATKVTNAAGHISYAQFDYHLGKPVNGQDPNGIVASGSYNDSLDRPTQIKRAIGTGAENQTTFAYDDVARIVTTTSDLTGNNDSLLVSKVVYDGLGRSNETRQYEGGSNYIKTEQQYDALGRLYKVSNPYRYLSESAAWTTTTFDALGRVTSVTTPDSAVVGTVYSGNALTVTDQAGKARKSVTDGLGRLLRVYEDPNGLNYETTYSYDILDNLVKVTQGSQQRFFMYDSLKRLIRSRNPEQNTRSSLNLSDPITGNSAWSVAYEYDAGGNLTKKIDARGVESTYVYDALNRNTTIDYSDTTAINPDVKRFYDGATNGVGRFWYSYKGGDYNAGSNVEHTSVDSYDALGRSLVQRQLFKLNGTWSPTYQITRGYNVAGGVTSQTYPSGRSVSYSYDSAGRTAGFTGNLGGDPRTYATGITYSSWGSIGREQFGTNTPLYRKTFYNLRGQLFDTRLSSVNDPWDWNRGRLILYYSGNHVWGQSGTDNNGNLRFAETWIPPANATLDQADTLWEDVYTYDALNRLSSVAEQKTSVAGGWGTWTQQFRQQYGYDRWGNRTIDAPQTWGTGVNNKQFAVEATTNRLGVPNGQSGVMTYDDAGNLINDTYSGAGAREYDAENKMTRAWGGNNQWQEYTYNADGQRTRRKVDGQETWQIYGMDGELLAEYAANGALNSPQKEYGYRNGQLLVTATGSTIQWLVTDHLGTPRMIVDQTGTLANLRRHDYLPFGEELFAPAGGRSAALGYIAGDGLRQQFTSKERDVETGLDYFGARWYASLQGRFTSVDPENYQARRDVRQPQSWNAYVYVNNNPLTNIDPDGRGILTKLKNLLLYNVWGEEVDVQRFENQARQMMLQMQKEAPNGELIVQSPMTGQWVLLHPEKMNRMLVFLWADAITASGGKTRELTPQEAASVVDSATGYVGAMRRLRYEASPKHRSTDQGNISKAPTNGQDALDNSLQIKPTSTGRIGIDYNRCEIVMFRETTPGTFHGYVVPWNRLNPEQKAALIKSGMTDTAGRILGP